MVSNDHFRRELRAQFARAYSMGSRDTLVSAAELHRMLGGYPGSQYGLAGCREAMRAEVQPGDDLLVENRGSDLTIRYQLPRKSQAN